ncbi:MULTISPECIES: DNA repair protein RecO [unclassified Lacticaseibacillus]|uniref:DNA repair protein RecO n=1 Tax=unclassified Lacticaseibacillus TaxID=2759744 RepID=UPI001942C99C|nr:MULTISPECIES: DNA repair protein RecO [unclassified Lacticaseibacillus]
MARRDVTFAGLVLSRQNYRESDMLVKLATDQFGKRMFLLHRARKPGFPLAAGILPFTQGTYVGTINEKGLSYLSTVKQVEQFQQIAGDISLNAYATYVLGLIDLAFPDGENLGPWFDFAATSLHLIDAGFDAGIVANIAEVQLLGAFGVAPDWRACVLDGRTDLPLDFSEKYGGLLCQDHWALDDYRFHVQPKALYLLRRFSVTNLHQLHSITVSAATKRELRRVLDRIYQDMVGTVPKAKRFLDQMQSWQDKLPPLHPSDPAD